MNLSLGQRRRMLREINTEFDVIIDRIAQESGNNPKAFVGSCEMKYPLTAGSGIFKGKSLPRSFSEANVLLSGHGGSLSGRYDPLHQHSGVQNRPRIACRKGHREKARCSVMLPGSPILRRSSCTCSIRERRLKRRLHAGIPNSTGLPTGAEVLLFRGSEKTAVPAGSSGKHRGFWSVRRISSCRQRNPFPRR